MPRVTLIAVLALAAFDAHAGTPSEAGFTESVFVSNSGQLGSITRILWAPDGSNRLFVTRKDGQVRIIKDGVLLATPFANVSPISANFEGGLLGIAFDHDYLTNRYVYFIVGISSTEQQIIRYTDVNDVGTSKAVIVPGLPTLHANHVGGGLAIGPDNHLYWGIGDLGNLTGVNADLASLASKVGRATLTGMAPNDNPFNDGPGPQNDFIFARGLRNPYALTFQPATGLLWVTSCGENYEQIWQLNAGDHAGWSAYNNNQPLGFRAPAIAYRTNYFDGRQVETPGPTRVNGVATYPLINVSMSSTTPFRPGMRVSIQDMLTPSFNGNFYIKSMPSWTSLEVYQPGLPDGASGVGSGFRRVETRELGGCVVGANFYQGTAFPEEYRGNLFFADFVGQYINRAVLGPGNVITQVDRFVTSVASAIDVASGPDGALYYASFGGTIYRLAQTTQPQALLISRTVVDLNEGSTAAFSVRLAQAPASNVTVSVARTAGDSDVTVANGATLTFTPANFATGQAVTIAAAVDSDASSDNATLGVSAAVAPSTSVAIRVRDVDTQAFLLSTASLTVSEGQAGNFTVALARAPAGTVTVAVTRTSGPTAISVTSGAALSFDPGNWSTPQPVTITAAPDANTTDDNATFTVTATGVPSRTVQVTSPDVSASAPVFSSTPPTAAVVNSTLSHQLRANGVPTPAFSLVIGPTGLAVTSAGLLTWTPTATGSVNVSVRAQNGVQPDAVQTFSVVVAADLPPRAEVTRPAAAEVVSGTTAEFFGDCVDDVGCTRGEFFVDGVLVYTDTNTLNHFHIGGGHLLWDTTRWADGPHVARLCVYDTVNQSHCQQVAVTFANGIDGGVALPDAGTDAGVVSDGGSVVPDAGPGSDAGAEVDAGTEPDAGAEVDAGTEPDAGSDGPDAGTALPGVQGSSCGCMAGSGFEPLFALALGLALRRRHWKVKA